MMSMQSEQAPVLKKFLRHLGKNRLDQTFFRYVSQSFEKRPTTINERGKSQKRYKSLDNKNTINDKMKTEASKKIKQTQANQTVTSFKVNEGPLGNSVRLRQTITPQFLHGLVRGRQTTFRDRMQTSMLNSFGMDKNSIQTQHILGQRQSLMKINHQDQILINLSGNNSISKLRIYKDKMRRFYAARYGREKLTTFLQYQYIQDYSTQIKYLEVLLSLNFQQIQFLCFITMDINSDGLICNNDLFTIATANIDDNPLINQDVYKIFEYASYHHNMRSNQTLLDQTSDDDPAKDISINLQKYKLSVMKSQKQTINQQSGKQQKSSSLKKSLRLPTKTENKGVILSRKINRHLFSLKYEEQQGEAAIKQLRKRFAGMNTDNQSPFKFKINFQRYQAIFKNIIPETYFDILYLQGGIKVEGKKYCSLNYDFEQVEKKETVKIEIDKSVVINDILKSMRQTNRSNKIEKFSKGNRWVSIM